MENVALEKLEKIVLWWVSMDREALDTIVGNVSSDYGATISKRELHQILLKLNSEGLVESFAFSQQEQKYISQAPVGVFPQEDIWWYVTKQGQQTLEGFVE